MADFWNADDFFENDVDGKEFLFVFSQRNTWTYGEAK